jgi:hypothetical protein
MAIREQIRKDTLKEALEASDDDMRRLNQNSVLVNTMTIDEGLMATEGNTTNNY